MTHVPPPFSFYLGQGGCPGPGFFELYDFQLNLKLENGRLSLGVTTLASVEEKTHLVTLSLAGKLTLAGVDGTSLAARWKGRPCAGEVLIRFESGGLGALPGI